MFQVCNKVKGAFRLMYRRFWKLHTLFLQNTIWGFEKVLCLADLACNAWLQLPVMNS